MAVDVDHIQYRESLFDETYENVLEQFKNSPNLIKLLQVIMKMKQQIDDATVSLAKLRTINTATGISLDHIGEELGVPRNGADDDDYRVLLKIRAYRTQTAGTRDQIIELLSRFTGTDESTINTYVGRNKTFDVFFFNGCLDPDSAISELIKIFPIISSYRLGSKAGTPFGFSSVFESTPPPFLRGFGSVFEPNPIADSESGHLASWLTHIE